MLKAVIFDMDGTLLDSEIVHYITIHEIIAGYLNYDQSLEEYMLYCGIPDAQMWPAILQDLEKKELAAGREISEWYEEIVRRLYDGDDQAAGAGLDKQRMRICEDMERLHWAEYEKYIEEHGVEAFPGMQELLAQMHEEGLKIAVATGSLRKIVEDNLDLLRIRPYVNAVATSEDCEYGKPEPDVFLRAAEYLQMDPADCLVVEDSENGMLAAERAGMCSAAFTGSRIPSQVQDPPAVFSDYRQVTTATFHEWFRRQKEY